MAAINYDEAANFWVNHDKTTVKMEKSKILEKASEFLASHNTCALATGCGDFVRATPLEYTFLNNNLYILSEGGMKFKGLSKNKNVSLCVFENYSGFGKISSIQITGTAEIIDFETAEYKELLKFKKIPEEAIKRLPHPMYCIKITPKAIDLLFSEFKKQGFDSRQRAEL